MGDDMLTRIAFVASALALGAPLAQAAGDLEKISHILVIYLENRSFDHLFGAFPGAEGINSSAAKIEQRKLDGTVYNTLPSPEHPGPFQIDGNLPEIKALKLPDNLPNAPFPIDHVHADITLSTFTRDLVHRFYTNRSQINGSRNDRYVAYSDALGLAMGHYSGAAMEKTNLWKLAQDNVLLDNYFQGAFGGSFLNHIWLVCACAPKFPDADQLEGDPKYKHRVRSELDDNGNPLPQGANPRSGDKIATAAVDDDKTGGPRAVNTIQSMLFHQDGAVGPLLPAQDARTIGDQLSAKQIDWAWYSGGWNLANLLTRTPQEQTQLQEDVKFQWHHQPFAYFSRFNRNTPEGQMQRRRHLKDSTDLDIDIRTGQLPPVAFYKPAGSLNQHPDYSEIVAGDVELQRIVDLMNASPMKNSYAIVITYDEFGGFFDHVAPPMGAAAGARADYFGPGPRVATIVVSPFVEHGTIDKRPYETTSILKLIADRFGLEPLPSPRFNAVDSLARVFEGP